MATENENEAADDLDAVLGDKFQELNTESDDGAENAAPEVKTEAPETAATETETENQENTDQTEEAKAKGTAPASAAIQAPVSWPAADKTKWSSIPSDLQQIIAKRESERDKFLTQKSNEFTQQLSSYKEIDHALAPVQQLLKNVGINNAQAVKELVQYYQHYESDPVSYILQVAQSKGIDLKKLVNGQFDKNQLMVQRLQNETSTLYKEINDLKAARENDEYQMLSSEITNFETQLGHEHFATVRVLMGKLMQTGEANSLQDAYDMAVMAHPQTRVLELARQQQERAKSNSATVKNAKRLAGPNLSTKEISGGKKATENEDDFLGAEYDRIISA